jgi:hypothetical protein
MKRSSAPGSSSISVCSFLVFAMETNESILTKARARIFGGGDVPLYLHIGYFMSWFSAVELHLTFLLAAALEFKKVDRFELLVHGCAREMRTFAEGLQETQTHGAKPSSSP